ncbi:unnamed protein product [Rotaria socialis]|uniref:Uncharacterized protein n=1 Tax=Rotaria socialis TaxID=392032 RepID=A0A818A441_9BILA|nr:unnamed protein product [Rotaria socialis]CAF3678672.1 unnamed protein product [Rotaria socialis]
MYQQLCNEHELLLDLYGSEESFHVYRGQPDADIQSILFDIEVKNENDSKFQRKPFADVNDICYDSSQYFWIFKISVINEIEYSSSGIIEEYKFLLASKSIETKLLQMDNFLYEYESSDYNILHKSKAEQCYNALLNVISPSNTLFLTCNGGLAWDTLKTLIKLSGIKEPENIYIINTFGIVANTGTKNCWLKLAQGRCTIHNIHEEINNTKAFLDITLKDLPVNYYAIALGYEKLGRVCTSNNEMLKMDNGFELAVECYNMSAGVY